MEINILQKIHRELIIFVVILFSFNFSSYSTQSVLIRGEEEIALLNQVSVFEDTSGNLQVDDIINNCSSFFKKNSQASLNFGYSLSTYWIHFSLENILQYPVEYILSISNPDLDFIEFYEFIGNNLNRKIITGEVEKMNSRDIKHHNYLFNINLTPNAKAEYQYYIKISNVGDANYIPIKLQERNYFYIEDNKESIVKWLVYGVLFFIVLFNFYLYKSLKEKLNLYYSLFTLFGTILNFIIDGYHYYLNIPEITNRSKTLVISFFVFFLLKFSELFIETRNKKFFLKKVFLYLRYSAILFGLLYFFKIPIFNIPISVISIVGSSVVLVFAFTAIILSSIITLDKNYSPSIYFLLAFISALLGVVIFQLKELSILPSLLVFENSVRIGLTFESILLTIAILERFRIEQENAKKLIEESLSKIELQNKELEIINSELEKLSIVASETNNSVAIYDKSGRIEWCNEGFEKFYETNISKLIQQKTEFIEEIIPFSNVKDLFKKCVEEKEAVIYEAQLKFNGKGNKWIHTTLSPYIKGHKVIAVDTDITNLKEYEADLKKAKDKAEESDRIKTIFLSNMSHEVRTPLNGILGFSELLNQEGVSREERERFVEIIKSNGEQLIRIIDDILDMSLIETNQLKIWNSDFSLTQLCEELVDFFEFYKTSVGKPDVKLISEFNINGESDFIHSDSSRLKQVLMNLLKNGFKFTDKGYVKFGCSANEDNILFFVEDTGIGIEPSKIEDVFKRFRQADERTTRKYGGNGLGLSISKGILEKMGGEIWIDPEYKLGFRICFVIPLNLAKKSGKKSETGKQQNFKFIGKNILIVEDHDISFQYLEDLFKPFSTKIFRAINGIEAIQKVKENHFDLVLMDINLPVLDGIEATKEVRKFNNDIPIIAQTAYAMSTEKDTILKSGCNDVISKPINSEKLFEKIEMFM